MGRNVYEYDGYTTEDGESVCVSCMSMERLVAQRKAGRNVTPIFVGEETSHVMTCDECGAEIETTVMDTNRV